MLLRAGITHIFVGTLVVALAALNYNGERKKEKARSAFLVLRCLVSSKSLPSTATAENMTTLLRMQGLRRISGLLCPITCPLGNPTEAIPQGVHCAACCPGQYLQLCPRGWTHSHVLATVVASAEKVTSTTKSGAVLFSGVMMLAVWRLYDPASIVTDIEDPELVPQMKFMAQVAQLLVVLVKATAAQPGCTICDHSARSVSPSVPTLVWATPTAAVWQDKSAIALRALSTLHWLSKPEQLQKLAAETVDPSRSAAENFQLCTAAHQAVGEALLWLLHYCLAGALTAHWAPLIQQPAMCPQCLA